MSEFKVIETQEQLDAIITARLERDRKSYAKQFEADYKEKGWKSPEEIEELTKDLNAQISTLQTAETLCNERDYFQRLYYDAELEKKALLKKIEALNSEIERLKADKKSE